MCSGQTCFRNALCGGCLIIPLVVRYVTYNLVYREPAEILHQAAYIAIGLFALVAVDCYSNSTFVIMDM